MKIAGHTILSITQVTNQVKYSLEQKYSSIWIQGEVASCKPYPSGHIYLTLKDGDSELSAVIFSQNAQQLTNYPTVGMQVVVLGVLSLYTPRGQFQLQIKNLYLSGEGELWLAFESLKNKLEDEGLFDLSMKKDVPRFPKCIGIITSLEGAALHDMIQVLNRRAPHVKCSIYPVPVQGKGAANKIAQAIMDMNQYGIIDLLIIGRGGGSLEELWCFNEEVVVRAIYNSQIPIISAIGHETDNTLSDFAADLRAPTPSAAAELAAMNRNEIFQKLDHYYSTLLHMVKESMQNHSENLSTLQKRHGFFKPKMILQKWGEKLEVESHNLKRNINYHIKMKIKQMEYISGKLELLNPKAQFQRGYSMVLDKNQNVIYSHDQVEIDDIVNLRLAKGELITKILKKGS